MECDYTHLNHNLLVSQKKSGYQQHDSKGGLLYFDWIFRKLISFFSWLHNHNITTCHKEVVNSQVLFQYGYLKIELSTCVFMMLVLFSSLLPLCFKPIVSLMAYTSKAICNFNLFTITNANTLPLIQNLIHRLQVTWLGMHKKNRSLSLAPCLSFCDKKCQERKRNQQIQSH